MKVVIAGKGGYGVKFLGTLLGKILMRDNQVVVTFDYDAASRGGDIIAYVVYDKEKIGNPTIDVADLLLKFSDIDGLKGKEVIEFNFDCKSYRVNMVALGYLLKRIGVEVSSDELKDLIKKDSEKNVEGILYGMTDIDTIS
ncbi:hypothetical protein CL616_04710 [archaeon]|nr:hypothetical protein [archaeon]|tara:strand:- start:1897 stop:2319 length:423 start_codon:yes stop_codon:yes gene_type:complete